MLLLALLVGALPLFVSRPAHAGEGDEEHASDSDAEHANADDQGEEHKKPKRHHDDDESDGDEQPHKGGADEDFGHFGQFGLRFGLTGGLRMVLRYDESPFCRAYDPTKQLKDQARFCGHQAPFSGDFGLSFAVLDWLEPFAWARLGFSAEKETDTKPLLLFGAGARIYTMSDSAFKIFLEPAVGLEFEKGRGTPAYQLNNPQYKQDFVFHLAAGPELDFSKYVGAYATGGITTGIVRAIHSSLDLQLGVQGRYP